MPDSSLPFSMLWPGGIYTIQTKMVPFLFTEYFTSFPKLRELEMGGFNFEYSLGSLESWREQDSLYIGEEGDIDYLDWGFRFRGLLGVFSCMSWNLGFLKKKWVCTFYSRGSLLAVSVEGRMLGISRRLLGSRNNNLSHSSFHSIFLAVTQIYTLPYFTLPLGRPYCQRRRIGTSLPLRYVMHGVHQASGVLAAFSPLVGLSPGTQRTRWSLVLPFFLLNPTHLLPVGIRTRAYTLVKRFWPGGVSGTRYRKFPITPKTVEKA